MPELHDFQCSFAGRLLEPASGRYAVHRNNWLHAGVDALRANYPVVEQLVGTDMFDALAVDYASARPPRSPVLALYGRGLPDWIEEQSWSINLPYLSEVARFERLHLECFFAEDAAPAEFLNLGHIAPEDWSGLRLMLHPATRFGWSTKAAMDIWLAHQDGCPTSLDIVWRSQGGLFLRPGLQVTSITLDAPAHRFLFGIRLGETVGVAAQSTASLYPDTDIGALFASLLNGGAFARHSQERIVQ